MEAADHLSYIEIACAQVVELLRAVRDEYRHYLKDQGAKPLAEMYWVVLRYGVKDWAVMALRTAAFEYIGHCRIKTDDWNALFDFNPLLRKVESAKASSHVKADDALLTQINRLLGKNVFDEVLTGGPFGRDGQLRLGQAMAGQSFLKGQTLMEGIKERQQLWDECFPWTEGLAMLFDATQEEVLFQYSLLGEDGRRAESEYSKLTPFQRIAYKHLYDLKSGGGDSHTLGDAGWLALLKELDEAGTSLDQELIGNARDVLMTLRRKGKSIDNWTQCYDPRAFVILEDAKRHGLKREVTRAIHNAARAARTQLEKVWGSKHAH
jgi:hypothetical protein